MPSGHADERASSAALALVSRPIADSSLLCENVSVGTLHLTNKIVFAGSTVNRSVGKSTNVLWTRCHTLIWVAFRGHTRPGSMQRLVGPGRPFRSSRSGLPHAFPENPSGLGPCGVSKFDSLMANSINGLVSQPSGRRIPSRTAASRRRQVAAPSPRGPSAKDDVESRRL